MEHFAELAEGVAAGISLEAARASLKLGSIAKAA
jgi:hypothetical protein